MYKATYKKVMVAGAGIGGLCTALAMARQGLEVQVFEQAAELSEVGAGIQISPNAMRVLNQLGVGKSLKSISFEAQALVMRHWLTGKPYLRLPLRGVCEQYYGAAYFQLHRAGLQDILYQKAQELGVVVQLGMPVTGYAQTADSVTLILENGEQHRGDLLVGCDGIRSLIRTKMSADTPPEFTGQVAWRGTVAVDRLPPGLIDPDITIWFGPRKHIVAYYIKGGDRVNLVAVEERDTWVPESWSQKGSLQELRHTFCNWHPQARSLLEACEECYLWGLFDRQPLPQWSQGRVVLLGDACHPMLPFMAQGAAMAIESAYVLAGCLNRQPLNLSQALALYEAIRKPRTTRMQKISAANARVFHIGGGSDWKQLLQFGLASMFPKLALWKLKPILGHDVTAL